MPSVRQTRWANTYVLAHDKKHINVGFGGFELRFIRDRISSCNDEREPAWEARDAMTDPYVDPWAWIERRPVLKPLVS